MGFLKVTLPKQSLLTALADSGAGSDAGVWWGVAGNVRRTDGEEFVLPSLSRGGPSLDDLAGAGYSVPFVVTAGGAAQVTADQASALLGSLQLPEGTSAGLISLSRDGQAAGWIRRQRRWVPVDEFRWNGAGMPCVKRQASIFGPAGEDPDSGRYSRLVGALGPQAYARMRGLRCAVVGVSRVGGDIATWMALMGIGWSVLVDPDVVEPHNADTGDFHHALDEGQNKAVATARRIARLLPPGSQVRAIPEDLLSKPAIAAVREADVIVTAVDDDGARLAASLLAASYMRVHLDIGTAVTGEEHGVARVGADVRLVLPDSPPRCLACFGGFAQSEDLRRLGGYVKGERAHWRTRRLGSLRSLNRIASNAGVRLIERLVAGDLDRSMWIRYEEGEAPSLREIVPPPAASCPLCRHVFGIGDEVLHDWDLRIRRAVRALVGAGE